MAEIDPKKRDFIHGKVEEAIAGKHPKGVDREWIEATTMTDRMYALELMRWRTYGKERCKADIKKVIEVVYRNID